MKHANYIIKNIDKWLEDDIFVLDHFFVPQNAATNPLTRYVDIANERMRHIRPNYWENTTDVKFPFMTYWVGDYVSGSVGGCQKDVYIHFRFTISLKDKYSLNEVEIDDEMQWLDELQSYIECKFQDDPNIFTLNECSDYETVDCDGNIVIEPFPYNVRGCVNGKIEHRFNDANYKNDLEYREYDLIIPFRIFLLFKGCPCDFLENDC